ncbi:MAG: 2-amino-4-hydroxy-6-hydroxymethyldihydropteridine diphosphokinase [Lysobacterales bacterium CG17_big_fil_post_rev_8_21_14_2_50_64_11]|nr:MAG: 2-amino-4-hydroxy-6-hydroxymethyldihydropteridine diphosphokinase [Xanthomonadales bacterium CG17_big_fil_post_rev_8_21_14_2_50_64_11]PIX60893.1 MAG: 2-amino-4-hydroxy-6-hydroxymethyldihydropteridine diphosphokinase [Xanthomonadales bacterium CG_4_10_14_3_um_filter_64_11]
MIDAFIGLGGNLGAVRAAFAAALAALATLPHTQVVQVSPYFRTPAWGNAAQADFINAAAQLRTALTARALLDALLAIERQQGRTREGERWGPRTLDLDLLLYGDLCCDLPGLHLPHREMHQRAFVLLPLAQIAPDIIVPGRGRVRDLLAGVDTHAITALT